MKKNNILIAGVILLVVVVGIIFYIINLPKYGKRDLLTREVLILENWIVESNGEYNSINLSAEGTFEVYDYPNLLDSGEWIFEENMMKLDFNSEVPDRIYSDFYFYKDGALYSTTDGNMERWIIMEESEYFVE
ncbi:hypothetical protein KJ641_00275 [Patescibacteria group bacterium]|nr:hypothetical protein [Patescibacteria group bacterium]MBU1895294.1 hypothetical protein [Patescibacteria group bacterium]